MIKVEHVTKRFTSAVAVADISFEVLRGEIVGFLGPNGAGKTTLMRLLATYLAPTQGRVFIDGLDVFLHSLEARRQIGYLPENAPLYPEMRVDEYLSFRAKLKGIPRRKRRERMGGLERRQDPLRPRQVADRRHRVVVGGGDDLKSPSLEQRR